MKWILLICVTSFCISAQPSVKVAYLATQANDIVPVSDQLIKYSTDKKSVQYIVIDLAAQVGLGYNWEKSFAQTDPECRKFVFDVSIKNEPLPKAMAKI